MPLQSWVPSALGAFTVGEVDAIHSLRGRRVEIPGSRRETVLQAHCGARVRQDRERFPRCVHVFHLGRAGRRVCAQSPGCAISSKRRPPIQNHSSFQGSGNDRADARFAGPANLFKFWGAPRRTSPPSARYATESRWSHGRVRAKSASSDHMPASAPASSLVGNEKTAAQAVCVVAAIVVMALFSTAVLRRRGSIYGVRAPRCSSPETKLGNSDCDSRQYESHPQRNTIPSGPGDIDERHRRHAPRWPCRCFDGVHSLSTIDARRSERIWVTSGIVLTTASSSSQDQCRRAAGFESAKWTRRPSATSGSK
eukprot:ctg_1073.g450